MIYRAVESVHYWIDYVGGTALIITGSALVQHDDLIGIALLIVGGVLLLAAVAGERIRRPRDPALDERVAVPSIHDDGSLR